MALTYPAISTLVRQRLNLPVSQRLRLQSLVSTALSRLSDKVALDVDNRHLLTTPRATTLAALTAGVADLSSLITSAPFINLNRIRCGLIYNSATVYPLEWISAQQAELLRNTDDIFYSIYLQGTKIYAKGLTGNLELAVPSIPTVATLPDALRDELIDKICELALGPTSDYSEDGEE